MYCPECRCDYLEGVTVCADCGCALETGELPAPDEIDDSLVTVFEAEGEVELMTARSLLDEAGIEWVNTSASLQGLFGVGPTGCDNSLIGPRAIQVLERDADAAREILKALSLPEADMSQIDVGDPGDEEPVTEGED